LIGCAPASDSLCVADRKLVFGDAALLAMTPGERLALLNHNETYARLCP
jgi:hypothetical protein